MFYSASAAGFFDPNLTYTNKPDDLVELTEKQYSELILKQSEGLDIKPDKNGFPVAVNQFSKLVGTEFVLDESAELINSQKSAIDQVVLYAQDCRKSIAGAADQYETAGWADKARRADRVKVDQGTAEDIAILQAEATRRNKGETVEQLVQLQLQKAGAFAMAVSVIDGMVAGSVEQIRALTVEADVATLVSTLKANLAAEVTALSGS